MSYILIVLGYSEVTFTPEKKYKTTLKKEEKILFTVSKLWKSDK